MLDYNPSEYEPFIIDCNIIQEENPKLVVIFDNIDDDSLKMLVYKLQSIYLFEDCRYDDKDREVVLIFNIPKEYKKDFEMFTEGKYSKFSEKYKKRLISYFGKETCTEFAQFSMFDALYPTEKKRKERAQDLNHNNWEDIKELFSVPNLDYERYLTIKELEKIYG